MHIVVFSWSLGLFVHACMFCLPLYLLPGYLFKVFNIPEYFNWRGLYLLVLRFCNDAVISRPLFEFFNPRSGGFLAGNLFQIPPHYLSTRLLIAFS
jgi:hypothetical protein